MSGFVFAGRNLVFRILYNTLPTDEGTTKTFTCARPLVGQYVAIQLVGVEGSLSLCEVEVFSNDGKFSASLIVMLNVSHKERLVETD